VKFPQLAQFSPHPGPMSALFLADSPARIRIRALKKIRWLSRFLPLIVLVSRSRAVKDHGLPPPDRGQQVPQPELEGREGAWPARQSCGAIQNHKHEEPPCVQRRGSPFRNQGIRRQGQAREARGDGGTRIVAATTFSNCPRHWLQVLALARSTLTMGGHARGFHGSPWRC
jgi:hypothetical protein